MWQWLYTGFIWHWTVLFTNNYTVCKYSMLFEICHITLGKFLTGFDNEESSVGLQAICILLCCRQIRKHCPQQLLDCCYVYMAVKDWFWCTYLAAGDQCLMLPSNGSLCKISLVPRFLLAGITLQYIRLLIVHTVCTDAKVGLLPWWGGRKYIKSKCTGEY
jgi:hypothetical protein